MDKIKTMFMQIKTITTGMLYAHAFLCLLMYSSYSTLPCMFSRSSTQYPFSHPTSAIRNIPAYLIRSTGYDENNNKCRTNL